MTDHRGEFKLIDSDPVPIPRPMTKSSFTHTSVCGYPISIMPNRYYEGCGRVRIGMGKGADTDLMSFCKLDMELDKCKRAQAPAPASVQFRSDSNLIFRHSYVVQRPSSERTVMFACSEYPN